MARLANHSCRHATLPTQLLHLDCGCRKRKEKEKKRHKKHKKHKKRKHSGGLHGRARWAAAALCCCCQVAL